jgi:prolyl oligopeptidase PreP (S9A serine peptidase family)
MSADLFATDENLWLEDIYGEAPLAWAAEQSAATLAEFASDGFDALTGRAAGGHRLRRAHPARHPPR